jgi:integrase
VKSPKTPIETAAATGQLPKEFLTEAEMNRFLTDARRSRHGKRDYAMMLTMYRHGLRATELIDLRLSDIDLEAGRIYVKRKGGGMSAYHPIEGDELRALHAWMRIRNRRPDAELPYLFLSERGPFTRQAINYLVAEIGGRSGLPDVYPQMIRFSTGYHLASRSNGAQLVQEYMGNKNMTSRYLRSAKTNFQGLWRR